MIILHKIVYSQLVKNDGKKRYRIICLFNVTYILLMENIFEDDITILFILKHSS